MCGNCCVFPESFFQGNTIQACGKQGVTAEMVSHPEARTNSYSMDPLTHSIKGMSDTPQDVSAPRAQSTRALQHQQPTWLLCPAFPSATGRAGHGLWQQGGDGQCDQGCWAQQQQGVMPQQSIVTHSAPPAHNHFGLKNVVSEGNALLQEGTCHKGAAQRPPAACFSGPVCLNSTHMVYRSLPSVPNAMSLLRLKFCS